VLALVLALVLVLVYAGRNGSVRSRSGKSY
jgi:hypothetical protein